MRPNTSSTDDGSMLFNLKNDPDELVDVKEEAFLVIGDQKSLISSTMSKQLMGWRAKRGPFKELTKKSK